MTTPTAEDFGLSDTHWAGLSPAHRAMYATVRPLRQAAYSVNPALNGIERTLSDLDSQARSQGGELQLNPDFQRGHVWSQDKQVAFMENVLRGTAPFVIRFNCVGWNLKRPTDMNPHDVVCIDGLQRITALRAFMAGDFTVFGGFTAASLDKSPFDLRRFRWTMDVFDIAKRVDLLQFYLDLNSGGVVHTAQELERVQALRDSAHVAATLLPAAEASRPKARRRAGSRSP